MPDGNISLGSLRLFPKAPMTDFMIPNKLEPTFGFLNPVSVRFGTLTPLFQGWIDSRLLGSKRVATSLSLASGLPAPKAVMIVARQTL